MLRATKFDIVNLNPVLIIRALSSSKTQLWYMRMYQCIENVSTPREPIPVLPGRNAHVLLNGGIIVFCHNSLNDASPLSTTALEIPPRRKLARPSHRLIRFQVRWHGIFIQVGPGTSIQRGVSPFFQYIGSLTQNLLTVDY